MMMTWPGCISGREGKWTESGHSLETETTEYLSCVKRHTKWLWSPAELELRTAFATYQPCDLDHAT